MIAPIVAWRRGFVGLACLIIGLAMTGRATADSPDTLRVQLLWHHQAQFAGIYVAEAKGYYEDAGLDVEIIEGGPGINPAENLGQGKIQAAFAWLPAALNSRARGWDIVNIAQIFRMSGLSIVCRRDAGIRKIEDIAGKTIGVWYMGDEITLWNWLGSFGMTPADVSLTAQFPDGRDLISGRADCATAMMYNEYWSILRSHLTPSDLVVFRLAEDGFGLLEDGLYATRRTLEDPAQRAALARFIAATVKGWAYAIDNVDEAFAITMAKMERGNAEHQRRMLETVLRLVGPAQTIGLIDVKEFDRSIDMIAAHQGEEIVQRAALGAWTQRLWYEGVNGGDTFVSLTDATRHRVNEIVNTRWFLGFVLTGAIVFGFAGFMRAQQRNYDLWGAFVLTLLPAAGGGIIRDLLVGGDRYPPFITQDPIYIYVVFGTFLAGVLMNRIVTDEIVASRAFDSTMKFLDTLGFATFAVVGAKVAIVAGLSWIWIPICCAITCAGGGMLSDIIMGREPRTFQGEPYEELAIIGGLFMLMGLQIADAFEHVPWIATAVVGATLMFVFLLRGSVIVFGIKFRPLARPLPHPAPDVPMPAAELSAPVPVTQAPPLEEKVVRAKAKA